MADAGQYLMVITRRENAEYGEWYSVRVPNTPIAFWKETIHEARACAAREIQKWRARKQGKNAAVTEEMCPPVLQAVRPAAGDNTVVSFHEARIRRDLKRASVI